MACSNHSGILISSTARHETWPTERPLQRAFRWRNKEGSAELTACTDALFAAFCAGAAGTTGGGGSATGCVDAMRGATIVGFCPMSPPVMPDVTKELLNCCVCMDLKPPPPHTPPCSKNVRQRPGVWHSGPAVQHSSTGWTHSSSMHTACAGRCSYLGLGRALCDRLSDACILSCRHSGGCAWCSSCLRRRRHPGSVGPLHCRLQPSSSKSGFHCSCSTL